MPIHPSMKDRYPDDWSSISRRIRFERADNRCEWCAAENYWPHPETGSKVVLTVAHLDHDPTNNADDNLAALCQLCHNTYDAPKRHSEGFQYAHAVKAVRWSQEDIWLHRGPATGRTASIEGRPSPHGCSGQQWPRTSSVLDAWWR